MMITIRTQCSIHKVFYLLDVLWWRYAVELLLDLGAILFRWLLLVFIFDCEHVGDFVACSGGDAVLRCLNLQTDGPLQLEQFVWYEVQVFQLWVGDVLLILEDQLYDGKVLLLSSFDDHRYQLQTSMRFLSQCLTLLDGCLVLSHQLNVAGELDDPHLDHLVWVILGVLSIDLVLFEVQLAATRAKFDAIEEVVRHVLANGSLDRAVKLLNLKVDLAMKEIEDPRLHRPSVDHRP